MKQNLLFLTPLILFLVAMTSYMSLDDAKDFVLEYYSNIEKTVNTGKIPIATDADAYIKMFGCDAEGNPISSAKEFPNPMFLIDDSEDRDKQARLETIFDDIAEFKHNHKDVTFHQTCVDYDYCRPPEMKKNEDAPTHAIIIYLTEWIVNSNKIKVYDTVYVDLRYKNISRICNKIIPLGESSEETLEDMLAKATFLYSNKRYNEASNLYYQITQKYPENGEAWYRYGVMWFKDQGMGRKHTSDECNNAAYYCWKKSDLPEAKRQISKLTDGRE